LLANKAKAKGTQKQQCLTIKINERAGELISFISFAKTREKLVASSAFV